MIIPDWRIRSLVESGHVGIDPFDPSLVQPASVALRLGPKVLRVFGPDEHEDVHEWRGRWLTVCHRCGATTSHTDPAAAARTTCPCQRGDTA